MMGFGVGALVLAGVGFGVYQAQHRLGDDEEYEGSDSEYLEDGPIKGVSG